MYHLRPRIIKASSSSSVTIKTTSSDNIVTSKTCNSETNINILNSNANFISLSKASIDSNSDISCKSSTYNVIEEKTPNEPEFFIPSDLDLSSCFKDLNIHDRKIKDNDEC